MISHAVRCFDPPCEECFEIENEAEKWEAYITARKQKNKNIADRNGAHVNADVINIGQPLADEVTDPEGVTLNLRPKRGPFCVSNRVGTAIRCANTVEEEGLTCAAHPKQKGSGKKQ